MADLATKIKLYVEANSKTVDFHPITGNVLVQNTGSGDEIAKWSIDGLAQPSDSDLSSYESAANTYESNDTVDRKRRTEYLNWTVQLDKLYHDINDGKFGDTAKTGTWYTHIKSVKDANSKG
tara:strand:+ start:126 stop:491 length:366 start_codon:yes stop_codon:yes gene_type:complete